MFKKETNCVGKLDYAVKRLLVNRSMYKLNGIVYFHHLIFHSIPSSLTNNEKAYAECLLGQRIGEGSESLPLLPPWLRTNSRTLKPDSSI